MSIRYLFPCPSCNKPIELFAVQAGQEIECVACQHAMTAPKLGVLKRLPTQNDSPNRNAQPVAGLKRTLFSLGLALFVLMAAAGSGLYYYATNHLIYDLQIELRLDAMDAQVDLLTPSQLLADWEYMDVDAGLGEWQEQDIARYRTQGQYLQIISYGMFGLAGIGLLMMVISFFLPGR